MTVTQNPAIKKCENVLRKTKKYNLEHSIWPSENRVIDILLSNSDNMECVYCELSELLNDQQIHSFLDLVLSCAILWNPEKTEIYRSDRHELIQTNQEIAKVASYLAELIEKRDHLRNHSGFSSSTHYSIMKVIEEASTDNFLFNSYLKKPLNQLRGQFDLKYWPPIEDVLSEISIDAEKAEVQATDSLTEASTASSRASKSDFSRALLKGIKEKKVRHYGLLPLDFELSNKSFAEIMNCTLQLGCDELVDAQYIKRAKQRIREQSKEYA